MKIFDDADLEPDTRILFQIQAKLDDYEVLYQQWTWSGIRAESFIFHEEDAEDLNDAGLEALARSSPMVKPDGALTIARGERYTFVNFNFCTPD